VIFVAVLEHVTDDFNRFLEWRVQLEGGKTGRELPALVDQIITKPPTGMPRLPILAAAD